MKLLLVYLLNVVIGTLVTYAIGTYLDHYFPVASPFSLLIWFGTLVLGWKLAIRMTSLDGSWSH
jgi:hypothetical protein